MRDSCRARLTGLRSRARDLAAVCVAATGRELGAGVLSGSQSELLPWETRDGCLSGRLTFTAANSLSPGCARRPRVGQAGGWETGKGNL